MIIRNALVYTTEHIFEKKDIHVVGERIARLCSPEDEQRTGEVAIDAEGLYAIPGLVDIHFHGAVGYDFCSATNEELKKIAEYEAEHGILAICPATMSYSEEILTEIMDKAAGYEGRQGARLVGINMEGPFISPGKAGAQNPEYIMPPDMEMFQRLQKRSGGKIKLADLAPEEPGAMEFIERCHQTARISLAHTCCNYKTAKEAFERGASHMTHLYNAMPGISHREPGPIIAAWEEGADVELIADGIHIHPAVVRATFRLFGAEKVILISDSMEATGLADGDYWLGGTACDGQREKSCIDRFP